MTTSNIATRIERAAAAHPDKVALQFPRRTRCMRGSKIGYQALSFKEFNQLAGHYAHGLKQQGVLQGDRVLVFVRPSIDFPALVFALFKLAATPVLIDPGMGLKNLLQAIEDVRPRVLISEPVVHILRKLHRQKFKSVELFFTTKYFGGIKLKDLTPQSSDFKAREVAATDLAAILFTSGGTGAPKGVEYTHTIFNAQTDLLQQMFQLTPDDIDVPGFPLFAFFTLSMGMTSVTPILDPTRPARCNPKLIVQNILDHKATFVAGSPAIWQRVADYCQRHQITLPSVKSVVMFGAPVRYELHQQFEKILPHGTTYTPYGATECLPVANISGREVLARGLIPAREGAGTLLGAAAPHTEIAIIPITEEALESMRPLPAGELGEIVVRSVVATRAYFEKEQATKLSKIQTKDGFWHRMGDLGRLDERGDLWFLGRKVHRVERAGAVIPSISFEGVFNHQLPLKRSALIGIGPQSDLALVVEGREHPQLKERIFKLARRYEHTKDLKYIFFKEEFPLDIRHNIKIDRKSLAREFNSRKELHS